MLNKTQGATSDGAACASSGQPRASSLKLSGCDKIAVLVLALLLTLIYLPAFTNEFGFHNDYRVRDIFDYSFDYTSIRGMLKHMESMHLLYVGRPVNAFAFNLHQSLFQHISDFAWGRLITHIVTIILAACFFFFARTELEIRFPEAFVLSLAVFCLPSFQLYTLWLANFIPGALNLLIATCVFFISYYGWARAPVVFSRANIISIAASSALLLICCLNYPPTALFILVYLFLFIAYSKRPIEFISLVSKRILFLTLYVLVGYMIFHKLIFFPWMRDYWGSEFVSYDPDTYSFSLVPNANLINFVVDSFGYGLASWMPEVEHVSVPIINATVVLIAAGLWLCLPPVKYDSLSIDVQARAGLEKLRLLVLTAGFSLAPFLVTPNSFVAYRIEVTWFAIMTIVIMGGYFLVFRTIALYLPSRSGAARAMLMTIAALGISLSTSKNVGAMVGNAHTELAFFRAQLGELGAASRARPARILVVLPPRYSLFVTQNIPLDLGYTATNYSGLMYGIIHMVAEELGVPRARYKFDSIGAEEFAKCEACASADIVIDMRKIAKRVASGRNLVP